MTPSTASDILGAVACVLLTGILGFIAYTNKQLTDIKVQLALLQAEQVHVRTQLGAQQRYVRQDLVKERSLIRSELEEKDESGST